MQRPWVGDLPGMFEDPRRPVRVEGDKRRGYVGIESIEWTPGREGEVVNNDAEPLRHCKEFGFYPPWSNRK